jgi:acetyl-CoA acyltransferase
MDAYLLDFARSPFQFARKGAFATLPPAELAAQVVQGLLARQAFAAAELEDVLLGCAYPEGEQGDNLARIVSFLAGLPDAPSTASAARR